MRRLIPFCAVLALCPVAFSAQADRIAGPIDGSRTVGLKGNIHPRVASAQDLGLMEGNGAISFARVILKPSVEQAAALERFLEEQRNPSSPDFRNWLTPEQFADRFGASENDVNRIASWLASQGLRIEQTARARNWVAFSGTAQQIGRAFHTEIHRFQSDGETHFANAGEPSIPAALAGIVESLRGLDDFHPKPQRIRNVNRDYTSSNGMHYLAPDDLAAIYDITALYQAGFDGTGQKIAIPGQTDVNLNDIRGFRTQFKLPAHDPQLVLTGPDPGVSQGDQVEADLDLEWSGAVARNATIVYVYSRDVFTSLEYAVDQNLAPVISLSYGACEIGNPASYRSVAQQANAQGITWMNSSGDGGAAGCDYDATIAKQGPSVIFPADIPEVTAVGGTEFSETGSSNWNAQNGSTWNSVTGYLPEKAWNDTAAGSGIWATGGGASALFTKPWWQTGPGVPGDSARDVPDISLTASGAHDGYLIYASGQLMSVGGTSASSPSFAGIVALLNQYMISKGAQTKPGLGNINPGLYAAAQSTTGIIHDVTAGDNIVPCAAGSKGCPASGSFGYAAGAGYDLATGLGSVDAYNLVTRWASLSSATGTATALAASPASIAQSGSTQLTATVSAVSGTNPPAGSVTFSAGGATLGSAALTASGKTATATLSVKGSALQAGANNIIASYAPAGSFSASTGSATVTVTGTSVATAVMASASPAGITSSASTQLTVTVKPASGTTAPGGSVSFSVGGVSLGSATLSAALGNSAGVNSVATLTVKGSSLTPGANTISVSYAGNSAFGASSGSVAVTVTAPAIATTTTVTASPSSVAKNGTVQITATVKTASGSAPPSGTVNFTTGGASLGSAALTGSGSTASAALSVSGAKLTAGSNTISAAYTPSGNFAASTGTVNVTVTAAAVATSMSVSASPSSIAASAATQLTAIVKPATGSAPPTGAVTFVSGSTALGTATLNSSGSSATATLSIKGSALAAGSNSIVATYGGASGFGASDASVAVTITPGQTATSTSITASLGSFAQSGSTQLTVTVKAASGSMSPAGSVAIASGGASLGSAALSPAAGGMATAAFTVKGSSLAMGSNTVTAVYSASGNFANSTGSMAVIVTATPSPTGSNVAITAAKASSTQPGWPVTVQLQEKAGTATTLTGFTINGTDFTSVIGGIFGSTKLPAHGTVSGTLIIQWSPLPANIVFVATGMDANGRLWSQTISIATK